MYFDQEQSEELEKSCFKTELFMEQETVFFYLSRKLQDRHSRRMSSSLNHISFNNGSVISSPGGTEFNFD
jgi:hypothetical protein